MFACFILWAALEGFFHTLFTVQGKYSISWPLVWTNFCNIRTLNYSDKYTICKGCVYFFCSVHTELFGPVFPCSFAAVECHVSWWGHWNCDEQPLRLRVLDWSVWTETERSRNEKKLSKFMYSLYCHIMHKSVYLSD